MTVSGLTCLGYVLSLIAQPAQYTARAVLLLRQPTLEERLFASLTGVGSTRMTPQLQRETMLSENFLEEVRRSLAKEGLKITLPDLKAKVSVEIEPDANKLMVAATASQAEPAKRIANAVVRHAEQTNRQMAREEFISARRYVEERIERYEKRLAEAERKLRAFNKEKGTVDFGQELAARIERLAQLQAEKEQQDMFEKEAKGRLGQLQQQIKTVNPTMVQEDFVPNPLLEEYQATIKPLEQQLMQLKMAYTEEHPKVKRVLGQIESVKEEYRDRAMQQPKEEGLLISGPRRKDVHLPRFVRVPAIKANPIYQEMAKQLVSHRLLLSGLAVRREILKEFSDREKNSLASLSEDQLAFFGLLREKETAARLLTSMEEMNEELGVFEVMQFGNAKVISEARTASKQKRFSLAGLAFILVTAFLLGVAAALVLDLTDDTVRSPYHVKRFLNLPLLGGVPDIRTEDRTIRHVAFKDPVAEALNKICFQIQRVSLDAGYRILVVTSPLAEEGKTTFVANLGLALVRLGEEVLLVDGDLRKPYLHQLFGVTNTLGLSTYLSEELTTQLQLEGYDESREGSLDAYAIKRLIQNTSVAGLRIIPSGPLVSNPVGLLRSLKVGTLFKLLRPQADFVIVDTPPVGMLIDPAVIAAHGDASIFLVDAGRTSRRDAVQAKSVLASLNIPMLGVVLNRVSELADYYYHYYYDARSRGRRWLERRSGR